LITTITMLFCFGPIDDAINAKIPYLLLFTNMNSNGVAIFLLAILFILNYIGNIILLATFSRETWAFAGNRGLPWSKWISKMSVRGGRLWRRDNIIKMDRKRAIPFNSVYLTSGISALLCLINLGSTLGFNTIVFLFLIAPLSTYTISIYCVFWKRIKGEPLPPARRSLGKHGIWINGAGFKYSLFAMVWCDFPAGLPVTTADANYGPALWVGICLLAAVVYIFHGRKHIRRR
jgi:choline transport protein